MQLMAAFVDGPRRRHCLCLLVLGVLRPAVAAVTANLRHSRARLLFPVGPDASALEVPGCTCGCCHVTYRTPDEMPAGGTVFLKCALDEVQGAGTAVTAKTDLNGKVSTSALTCGSSCVPPKEKKANTTGTGAILGISGESGASAIDYNRFCFYNCRPYDFNVGNICTKLSAKHQKAVEGEVDPALHPLVTDPEVQGSWAVATGAAPAPTEAPTTTTAPLPCEASDPCAYKMMNKSIQDSKLYYRRAATKSFQTADVASSAGKV